jgi:hypothetical protein
LIGCGHDGGDSPSARQEQAQRICSLPLPDIDAVRGDGSAA